MSFATTDYISIGGNRHSAAADWATHSGQFAFGADQYVAIWQPLHPLRKGITALLRSHTAKVTAVKFISNPIAKENECLFSGSANGELCQWEGSTSEDGWTRSVTCKAHEGAVNTITGVAGLRFIATGGADTTVKLWKFEKGKLLLVHTIKLTPRYIPLTLVLGTFQESSAEENAFIAVGGTRNIIQIFALTQLNGRPQHELHATLTGHEGWIRSLSLHETSDGDMLLASASHDKYVRLWSLSSGDVRKSSRLAQQEGISLFEQTLTSKVQTVSAPGVKYTITFEALLLGHEDWIYSAAWNPSPASLQLLTASADGSLTIWEPDPTSGIWVSTSRLGEISGQKGATTATGSAGGFWTGVWSPDGQAGTCLGRTGSWRLWEYDSSLRYWVQKPGVSGHVGSANSVSWSPCGSYLLSTSSDQTTRLHAEWRREEHRTWHEFARPQIHGYDLNCVTSVSSSRIVSGADEKLLRVFDEPMAVASMLKRLCQVDLPEQDSLPDVASMPVLGLSNKAVDDGENVGGAENAGTSEDAVVPLALDIDEPPTEDILARHTLWPEHEKLYGHGYEISAAAASHGSSRNALATACKASSLDHAVIRLYDTNDWHEIKPPLSSHTLTVTNLAFSNTAEPYLLSVGRDRQWTVYAREEAGRWKLCQSSQKAHSRMILDCAWSSLGERPFFATAGRDKTVKIWVKTHDEGHVEFTHAATLKHDSPVTALSFTNDEEHAFLATGEEDGQITLHEIQASGAVEVLRSVKLEAGLCLSKAVNRLQWRPNGARYAADGLGTHLAVAGADGSVRVLRVVLRR